MTDRNERIKIGDRVTIFRRGKKGTWTAEFSIDGIHKRQSLKTQNKKIATERATQLAAQVTTGQYRTPATEILIDAARDQYLDYLAAENRAPKTIVRYRGELTAFAEFCRGRRVFRLSQITPSLFDGFRKERKAGRTMKTLFHEAMVVKQWLNWCVSRQLLAESPFRNCRVREPVTEPRHAPTLAEVLQILSLSTLRQRVMLAVLAFTGMRSGELRQLRKKDVDLKNGWIHIVSRPGARTKTGRSRKVPIHALLQAFLKLYRVPPAGEWFFAAEVSSKYPDGGHHVNTKRLNEYFLAVCQRANLPVGRDSGGYTLHALRHFFETHTVNAGIPQRVIDTWLGHHSDRSMASVYYRLSDAESAAFMAKVSFGDGIPAANAGETQVEEEEV